MKYIVSIALLASAAMAQVGSPSLSASQCDASHLQCCDTVGPTSSNEVTQLLSLLNIPADGLTGEVGLECKLDNAFPFLPRISNVVCSSLMKWL